MSEKMVLWTAQPSDSPTAGWYVWDMYAGLPPRPVFFGDMIECQAVAEQLNARILRGEES